MECRGGRLERGGGGLARGGVDELNKQINCIIVFSHLTSTGIGPQSQNLD